ncbi:putative vesicle-fusing ATPase [Helianthus annuus]|uniref:Putative MIT n=1 Tax=Helianthus annuus TaxID=4232 RepID=A0A251SQ72_HELAN|nr:protein SUPPRESSOR OF K(+) TRANSPORT GROWTH DEFECT 1 [Helianthus annuus]KAF5772766.1 putative vesicle-fusing ATPase [Helianthus annuus]
MMYSNFKQQAIEYVKQAVQEDTAGNYAKAFPLYMNALEYFRTHLKYEKDPKIREAITQKFTEYLRRAEEIRAVIDEGRGPAASGGASAVQPPPKTEPKEGEGEGEDTENQLSGVKALSFKEQAIEYIKQAVQEDNARNYAKAFPLYMNALEYFKAHMKYEKNPKIIEAIMTKFTEYMRRAEEIRAVLDEGRAGPATSGGHAGGEGSGEGRSQQ